MEQLQTSREYMLSLQSFAMFVCIFRGLIIQHSHPSVHVCEMDEEMERLIYSKVHTAAQG